MEFEENPELIPQEENDRDVEVAESRYNEMQCQGCNDPRRECVDTSFEKFIEIATTGKDTRN